MYVSAPPVKNWPLTNWACLTILFISCVAVATTITGSMPTSSRNEYARLKSLQLLIYTTAAASWPVVLASFARNEWMNGQLFERPVMWICTTWVIFVFALDVFLLDRTPNQEIESIDKKRSEYLTTSNVLIGAVFTFGVLISHVHNKRSSRAAMITLTSLLLSILFVLPVFDIDHVDPFAFVVMAIIKVACVYSVGLFVVAIALEITGSAQEGPHAVQSPSTPLEEI